MVKILGLLEKTYFLVGNIFQWLEEKLGEKKISFLKHIIEKCIADNNTLECYFFSEKEKKKTCFYLRLRRKICRGNKKKSREIEIAVYVYCRVYEMVGSLLIQVSTIFSIPPFFRYQCRGSTTVHKIIFSLVVYVVLV